jgi:hypothetical protein
MLGPGRFPAALLLAALAGCSNDVADRAYTDFVVAVGDETFVVRAQTPEAIGAGLDLLNGRGQRFPVGRLLEGDGGFNAPWSWHIDPATLTFTEVAIEVCDGTPSYVEAHVEEYARVGYCPWGGRVTGVRP